MLYNMQRYQEALEAYEQAIRLDPQYAYAYSNKAVVLAKLRRKREAREANAEAARLRREKS